MASFVKMSNREFATHVANGDFINYTQDGKYITAQLKKNRRFMTIELKDNYNSGSRFR